MDRLVAAIRRSSQEEEEDNDDDVALLLQEIQEILREDPELIRREVAERCLPLHYALGCGAPLPIIEYLVGAFPEALRRTGTNGWLPIHVAAQHSSPDVVEFLADADPETLEVIEREGGGLPLHVAAYWGAQAQVLQCLLDRHARAAQALTFDRMLPLHLVVSGSGNHSNVEELLLAVQVLIDANPSAVRVPEATGWLPVHLAAEHAPVEVVDRLLEQDPATLQVVNEEGMLPLHVASTRSANISSDDVDASEAALRVVQRLVNIDPTGLVATDAEGWLPLHCAAQGGNVQVLHYLVDASPRAALAQATRTGRLPLHVAAQRWSPDAICVLVDAYPEAQLVADDDGRLPAHLAAASSRRESSEAVQVLGNRCPQALEVRDLNGLLPLHVAIIHGAPIETVQPLVNGCPSSLEAMTGDGNGLPIHLAIWNGAPVDVTSFLVARCPRALRVRDHIHGWLPMHFASDAGDTPTEVFQTLLDGYSGALMVMDPTGRLPSHLAARGMSVELMELIANACPRSLEVKDNTGWLPSHLAAYRGSDRMNQFLADRCPQALLVPTDDGIGRLPLHIAVNFGSAKVAQYLAKACPLSVATKDKQKGFTPLHLAASMRGTASFEMIQSLMAVNEEALLVPCREGRFPVHVAAVSDASLDAIYVMARACPRSL